MAAAKRASGGDEPDALRLDDDLDQPVDVEPSTSDGADGLDDLERFLSGDDRDEDE